MIAPTSETIRYTANRRLGYHGGLTPQECIAPVAVLAPALMEIEGWEAQAATPPNWWFEREVAQIDHRPRPKKKGRTAESSRPTATLFETSPSQDDWVAALLNSDVFTGQMETFAGRLKREQVEQSLQVLADRNLVLMKGAFHSLYSVD
jgi:hypothetical protein